MAKALLGSLTGDPLAQTRLASENRQLRQRVMELEALVLRLSAQNDQLISDSAQETPIFQTEVLQPV